MRPPKTGEAIPVVPLSVVYFADKQVALGIGCEAVCVEEFSSIVTGMTSDLVDDLEGLSIQDVNQLVGTVDDV